MLNIAPLAPDPWLNQSTFEKIAYVQNEAKFYGLDCPEVVMSYVLISETEALAVAQGWRQPPDMKKFLLANLVLAAAILQGSTEYSLSIKRDFERDLKTYITL